MRDDRQFLIDGRDAAPARSAKVSRFKRFTEDFDDTPLKVDAAGDRAQRRGLARSVLADQRMYRSFVDLDVHIDQCAGGTVGLRHRLERDGDNRFRLRRLHCQFFFLYWAGAAFEANVAPAPGLGRTAALAQLGGQFRDRFLRDHKGILCSTNDRVIHKAGAGIPPLGGGDGAEVCLHLVVREEHRRELDVAGIQLLDLELPETDVHNVNLPGKTGLFFSLDDAPREVGRGRRQDEGSVRMALQVGLGLVVRVSRRPVGVDRGNRIAGVVRRELCHVRLLLPASEC